MPDITSAKNGNVQHSFGFLVHGSQSHSSNIPPGRHSESNPHSPAGHCRWDNSVLTSAPWSHPAHPRPRVVDGNLSPIPEQQLHAAGVQPFRCAKMCRAKIIPLKLALSFYAKPRKQPGSSPKRQLRYYLFRPSIKCTSTTTIHGRDLDNRTDITLI